MNEGTAENTPVKPTREDAVKYVSHLRVDAFTRIRNRNGSDGDYDLGMSCQFAEKQAATNNDYGPLKGILQAKIKELDLKIKNTNEENPQTKTILESELAKLTGLIQTLDS